MIVKSKRTIPVIGTNKETEEEIRFNSVTEAAVAFGSRPSAVSQAIVMGHALKGYYWRKEGDDK